MATRAPIIKPIEELAPQEPDWAAKKLFSGYDMPIAPTMPPTAPTLPPGLPPTAPAIPRVPGEQPYYDPTGRFKTEAEYLAWERGEVPQFPSMGLGPMGLALGVRGLGAQFGREMAETLVGPELDILGQLPGAVKRALPAVAAGIPPLLPALGAISAARRIPEMIREERTPEEMATAWEARYQPFPMAKQAIEATLDPMAWIEGAILGQVILKPGVQLGVKLATPVVRRLYKAGLNKLGREIMEMGTREFGDDFVQAVNRADVKTPGDAARVLNEMRRSVVAKEPAERAAETAGERTLRFLKSEAGKVKFEKPLPPETLKYTTEETALIVKFEEATSKAIQTGQEAGIRNAVKAWLEQQFSKKWPTAEFKPETNLETTAGISKTVQGVFKWRSKQTFPAKADIDFQVQRLLQSGAFDRGEAAALAAPVTKAGVRKPTIGRIVGRTQEQLRIEEGLETNIGAMRQELTQKVLEAGKATNLQEAQAVVAKLSDKQVISMLRLPEAPVAPVTPEVTRKWTPEREKLFQKDLGEMYDAGKEIADELKANKYRLNRNLDGTITIYHGTSEETGNAIKQTGRFNEMSFFSHAKSRAAFGSEGAKQYGPNVLEIKADPRDVFFNSGTGEIEAEAGLVRGKDGVWRAPDRVLPWVVPEAPVQAAKAVPGAARMLPAAPTKAVEPRVPTPPTELPPTPPVKPPEAVPPTGAVPPAQPEALGQNILGLKPITPGLSRKQEFLNLARRTLGKPFGAIEDNPVATAAMQERARVQGPISSLAAQMAAKEDVNLKVAFKFDKKGRIPELAGIVPDVPGAPTLADVAARLPLYKSQLSETQVQALKGLEDALRPYRHLLEQTEVELHTRADIMEGGFYVPRGRADAEGADLPLKVGAGFGRGMKKGFEKPAVFPSQAEGIEKGYIYSATRDALQSYARDAGVRATDAHVANYFKTAMGEAGQLLGETPKMRMLRQNPTIAKEMEGLRGEIQRLRSLSGRLSNKTESVIDNFLSNPEFDDIDSLREELASIIVKRGKNANATLAEVKQALKDVQERVMSLRPSYKHALEKARITPREEGVIGMPALTGRTFPDAIANAAKKVLSAEGAPRGALSSVTREIMALNNLYRGLTATLDNSALGVQGLLGAYSDPRAYAKAHWTNFLAWGRGGDDVLGKFFNDFDQNAIKSGRASVEQWARNGLHIGGAASEFELKGFIQKVPGVKQANRAFGYFGDSLRLAWADDELSGLLRKGTLPELEVKGELNRIAKAVNGATGWAETRFTGDFGELLLYAPRYLQARLETVVRAVAGFRPGASLEQRIARNSLLKMIGLGVLLTVGANALLGQDTDFRPIVKGRRNYNFMRIRAFGRDWSVFGTWDSLLGAIIETGTGHPERALKSMGSGVVQLGWELIGNKDWDGNPVRDNPVQFGRWLLESLSPFALEEMPAAVGQAIGGKIPAGVVTIAGEVTGAKSAPVTAYESLTQEQDRITKAAGFKNAKGELITAWDDLGPKQQAELQKANPQLAELEATRKAQAGTADLNAMAERDRQLAEAMAKRLPKNMQAELTAADVTIGVKRTIQPYGTDFYLNDARYQRYQDLVVEYLTKSASAMAKSTAWKSKSTKAKEYALQQEANDAREAARTTLMKEINAEVGKGTPTKAVATPTMTAWQGILKGSALEGLIP